MKLYLYYIINQEVINHLYQNNLLEMLSPRFHEPECPFLYAHTDDKKLAKLFKKTRNMNVIKEIVRTIDREEYEAFPSDAYRSLRETTLNAGEKINVTIPLNGAERWSIENSSEIFYELFQKMNLPPIDIFEDDIAEVLDILDYGFNSGSHYNGSYDFDSTENRAIARGAWTNDLGIIIALYFDLFNIDACTKGGLVYETKESSVSDLCKWR